MIWSISAVFFAVVAGAMLAGRRQLAQMQGLILGGTMAPGCVMAEALVLLALAAAFVIFS